MILVNQKVSREKGLSIYFVINQEKDNTIVCVKKKIIINKGIESMEAMTIILENTKYIGG